MARKSKQNELMAQLFEQAKAQTPRQVDGKFDEEELTTRLENLLKQLEQLEKTVKEFVKRKAIESKSYASWLIEQQKKGRTDNLTFGDFVRESQVLEKFDDMPKTDENEVCVAAPPWTQKN